MKSVALLVRQARKSPLFGAVACVVLSAVLTVGCFPRDEDSGKVAEDADERSEEEMDEEARIAFELCFDECMQQRGDEEACRARCGEDRREERRWDECYTDEQWEAFEGCNETCLDDGGEAEACREECAEQLGESLEDCPENDPDDDEDRWEECYSQEQLDAFNNCNEACLGGGGEVEECREQCAEEMGESLEDCSEMNPDDEEGWGEEEG